MYIAQAQIEKCLSHVGKLHPFFGITYLVCKKGHLPVGRSKHFPINKQEADFLNKYFKPDVTSKFYFQPFKTSSRAGRWLSPKYPYSGSQSTRTRGDFEKAFIHEKNTDLWGWSRDYVESLKAKLLRDRTEQIPAFWLAVWLFRERKWPASTQPRQLVRYLLKEFSITEEECSELFDLNVPQDVSVPLLDANPCTDKQLLTIIGRAPDASPEVGGTLRYLELVGIGPTKSLKFSPGDRLTVITGDNGLGKTFILECAWWSLTGTWAESQAIPSQAEAKTDPKITFEISAAQTVSQKKTIHYNWDTQRWPEAKDRPTIPGLIVYARVDGSFAVWDPVRHLEGEGQFSGKNHLLVFSRDEVLRGLEGKIEGLLRDWVKWQHSPDQSTFDTFRAVLKRLSPPDMWPLEPGAPVRLPRESMEFPTIKHRYGAVPFPNESAGVRRIITLSYLLVWAWNEHKVYSGLAKKAPQNRLVVLVDETEAHLHPKWQRAILPSLLDVTSILSREIQPQMIVTTHSPLVLASLETIFSEAEDKLYHLHLTDTGDVEFKDLPFIRFGSVDDWLTSAVFELKQPRSREGEEAVEKAKGLMAQKNPKREDILSLTDQLRSSLPADDTFWHRWVYFAEQRGISL